VASSIKPISVTFAAGSDPFVTAILRLAVASGRFTSPHAIVSMISLPSATAVVEIEAAAFEPARKPRHSPEIRVSQLSQRTSSRWSPFGNLTIMGGIGSSIKIHRVLLFGERSGLGWLQNVQGRDPPNFAFAG